MKKAFTLIELLFVMTIVSILAAMSFSAFSTSTKSAIKASLINDTRNAIATEESFFASNQEYDSLSECTATEDNHGLCHGDNGAVFAVSKDNTIEIEIVDCDNGAEGFDISLTNEKIENIKITFNSCEDATPQQTEI